MVVNATACRGQRGMKQATITINGRLYDALTGQPVSGKAAQNATAPLQAKKIMSDIAPKAAAVKAVTHTYKHPAAQVHSSTKRSATLNRTAVQKPRQQVQSAPSVRAQGSMHASGRSPLISKHHQTVVAPAAARTAAQPEIPGTTPLHPSVLSMLQRKAAQQKAEEPMTSKELKEKLIKERLAEVSSNQPAPKLGLFARKPRLASILATSLVLLILGGYFTYINLTNISMRVAASNAGINASFPGYKPDGYSLNGPITYAPGEVGISYKSNTNDTNFTLTQKSSNWDSQGVLDNYVRKQTSTYLTFQQRGVTVYTFSNKAAWTNGGLLYTIEGDASLSSEQILKLATSL
jgi:hypothetical protein